MFASKAQRTVIAKGLKVAGTITADGLVEILGEVDGGLNCTSVIVGRDAHVSGTIVANSVVVDGTVEGPIKGADVVLNSHARIIGDVQCGSLIVEKGAVLDGRMIPINKAISADTNHITSDGRLTVVDTAKEKRSTHQAVLS